MLSSHGRAAALGLSPQGREMLRNRLGARCKAAGRAASVWTLWLPEDWNYTAVSFFRPLLIVFFFFFFQHPTSSAVKKKFLFYACLLQFLIQVN